MKMCRFGRRTYLCRCILQLARLERLVSKQEELLRNYRPPVQVTPLDPELKRKVRIGDRNAGFGANAGVERMVLFVSLALLTFRRASVYDITAVGYYQVWQSIAAASLLRPPIFD